MLGCPSLAEVWRRAFFCLIYAIFIFSFCANLTTKICSIFLLYSFSRLRHEIQTGFFSSQKLIDLLFSYGTKATCSVHGSPVGLKKSRIFHSTISVVAWLSFPLNNHHNKPPKAPNPAIRTILNNEIQAVLTVSIVQ